MAREFKLPDLGEGIHEGEIVEIFVKPGDAVKEGDPLLEVETDKAVTAIPSPFTGAVRTVMIKPGDTVRVGDVLVVFDGTSDKTTDGDHEAAPPPAPTTQTSVPPVATAPPGRRQHPPVPASPATRRLARELSVDLLAVRPTGPEGLVTAEDVRRHAHQDPAANIAAAVDIGSVPALSPNLPDFSRWGPVAAEPMRSVRKATARQMALAWSQIPHVANQDEADVTRLEAWRKRHGKAVAEEGGRLTMTVLAVKAAVAALKRFPRFNASLDMAEAQIIYKQYYHVGVAVDSPRGLIVPVLKDVNRKSIRELSLDFAGLVDRAREGQTPLEELQGATFTITNAGAVGGGHFAPIINYPQVAILGLGRARLKPVVRTTPGGAPQITPRLMMPLVLSFDHRIADGADAIRFMQTIIAMLEDPEQFLLEI
ncbi:MAG: dihydrolipoamide acetyltransferase family protein [Desulfobacterales bacterium]|jgi:pyruvate dehydrogenase E2 component (dihydrolipoamide acetyltransferase)